MVPQPGVERDTRNRAWGGRAHRAGTLSTKAVPRKRVQPATSEMPASGERGAGAWRGRRIGGLARNGPRFPGSFRRSLGRRSASPPHRVWWPGSRRPGGGRAYPANDIVEGEPALSIRRGWRCASEGEPVDEEGQSVGCRSVISAGVGPVPEPRQLFTSGARCVMRSMWVMW